MKVGLDVPDGVLVVNFLLVAGVSSFGLGFGNWLCLLYFDMCCTVCDVLTVEGSF